ncbi:MAG: hypothetical protein RJQ04_16015 [Longimicrobiales bacterium]
MNPAPDLSPLARFLAGAAVPPRYRPSVLGDMVEEYRRRSARLGRPADAWLWTQIVTSAGPWIAFRAARSRALRTGSAPVMGTVALVVTLSLANTAPVLGAVRALPGPAALFVAGLLNLGAMVLGAFLTGRLAAPGGRPWWLLSGFLTSCFVARLMFLPQAAVSVRWIPDPAWAAALVAASVVGLHLARSSGPPGGFQAAADGRAA